MTRHALIVGGGIGGLTAALCLAEQGIRASVFEQAAVFSELGAGIQLSPNCSRVLHQLGLEDSLRQTAFLPEKTEFRQWKTGKLIAEAALGAAAHQRYGAPYYHIHRSDLLALLVDAAEKAPLVELHRNAQVSQCRTTDPGISIECDSQEIAGDLLVGADGIHSNIRKLLWGQAEPVFTGNVAWRALVPAAALPAGLVEPSATVWWGPGKHFVHYYVRGGELVNCVCVVEKPGWEVESWTQRGEVEELKADFAGWHDSIAQLIEAADHQSLYKWALFDRPPMQAWTQGRATLLGDACHATLPFMAQGAAMAIEDGAVLAGCLASDDKIEQALLRYEALRLPRTAAIQRGSRRNARVFHLKGVGAWLRNRGAGIAGNRTMDQIYRYNPLEQPFV